MDVRVVDHPLARARLSTMRDARTDNAAFRAALRDLTLMLIYEATRDAADGEAPIHTPVARTIGYRLANPPLLVPVLRAGLGMADAAQALMPEAQMGFVGMARNEETHQPMPYMESLPESLAGRPVFVLDPMLATGGSMVHTIGLLTERGRDRRHRDLRAGRARGHRPAAGERPAGAGGHRDPWTSGSTTRPTSSRARRRGRPAVRRRLDPAPPAARGPRPRTGRPRPAARTRAAAARPSRARSSTG